MRLRIDAVSHAYGAVKVLDQISFEIGEGTILCLVGPSGCGKSTLLRLIGGLEQPSAGQIQLVGSPSNDCLNPLTFVFQDFALLPWRTVEGNVSLVLEDHRIDQTRSRIVIDDVLERTGLSEFAKAFPKQLSGGMKQRVAIARALAVNPAVMLLDEPLSALDSQTRELLMDDFISLWERSPFTGVYVTHNLAEAVRLGHSIAVLSRRPGRIREIVHIDRPLSEREFGDSELESIQRRLWMMMREEAIAADSELIDV